MTRIYRKLAARDPATGRARDPDAKVLTPEGPYYSKPYGVWPFRRRRMWTGGAVVATVFGLRIVSPEPMWASSSIPDRKYHRMRALCSAAPRSR